MISLYGTRLKSYMVLLLFLPILALAAPAADVDSPPETIDPQQAILVIDDLAKRGILPDAHAAEERSRWQQRIQPARNLRELIWTISSVILLASTIALLRRHIWPLLESISPLVYEALSWLLCAGVIGFGWWCGPPNAGLIALPGLLGLFGALALSLHLHARDWCRDHRAASGRLAGLALTIAWSTAAIVLQSNLVGWLAACGMLFTLGFIAAAGVGWIGVGFNGRSEVPVGICGALVMVAIGLLIHLPEVANSPWRWLLPGVERLGASAFLLGMLILANEWYRASCNMWWWWNIVALAAMLGCAYLGDLLYDPYLKGLGATMICILLVQKYVEEVWRLKYWMPGLFIFGLLLWGLNWLIAQHPWLFSLVK